MYKHIIHTKNRLCSPPYSHAQHRAHDTHTKFVYTNRFRKTSSSSASSSIIIKSKPQSEYLCDSIFLFLISSVLWQPSARISLRSRYSVYHLFSREHARSTHQHIQARLGNRKGDHKYDTTVRRAPGPHKHQTRIFHVYSCI